MAASDSSLIEKALLEGKWKASISDSASAASKLAKQVVDGDFRAVLTNPFAQKLFQPSRDEVSPQGLGDLFDFSAPLDSDPISGELIRLSIAVACLHAFVQANWTGPELNLQPLELLTLKPPNSIITEQFLNDKAISELAYGGEPAYHLSKFPAFLRLAQLIFAVPFAHLQSPPWWRLRTTLLHQRTLDEPVPHVLDFQDQLDSLSSSFIADDPPLLGRMYLERGLLDHTFSQDKSAAEYFVKAARATGLEYELTGALGKRTKFQVNELSQLVLLAESHLGDGDSGSGDVPKKEKEGGDGASAALDVQEEGGAGANAPSGRMVPETLALNDDTLLEQTEFTSSRPAEASLRLAHIDPSAQPALHPLDQCTLLSLCLNVKNTSPAHGLTNEQMAPYVARVISHPRNWSVHTMALLLRSRLESTRTRTVERSTFQLQALIDQMPTSDSALPERLLYFHSIPLPSKWEMEKELALRYMSLGVVKSALEIFERWEMWEEVVKCWGALERPEKGIAVLRDLLEGRKAEADVVLARGKELSAQRRALQDSTREAKLWCLLGDLEPENAAAHYQHAWAVSKESSGRAMRSLGGYHFARGNYEEAIVCLKRAVVINPLLARSWFILGCACMRVQDWEGGRVAFSRCVAIDEEDGESWSNLASMYLRLGQDKDKLKVKVKDEGEGEGEGDDNDNDNDNAEVQDPDIVAGVPFANKMLAFRALKQGLKLSYENWRMWYNYMIVAMDVGELQEACRALGRVVEETAEKVGARAVDEDVLERLVDAVTRAPANANANNANVNVSTDPNSDSNPEDAPDADSAAANPNEGHGLFKSVSCLFESTILPRTSSPRIFRAYARLLTWQGRWAEALKAHLDGYRGSAAGTMEVGGTEGVEDWREAAKEVEDIVDVLRNFGPRVKEGEGEGAGRKWRLKARSIVRIFMARTREFEDEPEWKRLVEIVEELKKGDA